MNEGSCRISEFWFLFPREVGREMLETSLLCMLGLGCTWGNWGITARSMGEVVGWEQQCCAVWWFVVYWFWVFFCLACLFVCLGFFVGESCFAPLHKALAIYPFIKIIFIRLVMNEYHGTCLTTILCFWGLKCVCVSKRREYFYSSIWSHLLLFLHIFYCNQMETSEY